MANQYIIQDGSKFLQYPDGSISPVVAALLPDDAQVKLDSTQYATLTGIQATVEDGFDFALATAMVKLNAAPDLVRTFTYNDPGTVDQRTATIAYSSASLSLGITETFVYAGSAGGYYLTQITRALT